VRHASHLGQQSSCLWQDPLRPYVLVSVASCLNLSNIRVHDLGVYFVHQC